MTKEQEIAKVGARKSLWFNASQINLLEELKEVTRDSGSAVVRDSLIKYKEYLDTKESK